MAVFIVLGMVVMLVLVMLVLVVIAMAEPPLRIVSTPVMLSWTRRSLKQPLYLSRSSLVLRVKAAQPQSPISLDAFVRRWLMAAQLVQMHLASYEPAVLKASRTARARVRW
jgi:Na+-transporting methylmalonyl-CoA/oxaloacetate decarboxylase gamma subunit